MGTHWLVQVAVGYGIAGAAVALVFLLHGIERIDAGARAALAFRPLLAPGIILLWPLVLWRWLALERGRTDATPDSRPLQRAHRVIWVVLAVLLPLIVILALVTRQVPSSVAPVRLEAPR